MKLSASAAAVSTVIGVSLSALDAPVIVAAVAVLTLIATVIGTIQSLFIIAQSSGGIYSTATGTGTFYDKVEAFAHDFTIMVVGIVTLTGSVKSIEASLSSFKSAAQELFGRKSRLTPSEVTKTYKGAKLITSFDDFAEYAKGFLDDDALQYVKGALGNDAEDTARLKKVARLIEDGSGKIGRKLSKEEIKAGLDALWDDAGVEGALAAVERVSKSGFGGKLTIIESGNYSTSEINAAKYMASQGYDVVLRPPKGTRRDGGTSDLLVNGINYDIYTPITNNPSSIIRAITKKNTQTLGVVLDLSNTSVTVDDLGNILARVKGAIESKGAACNINDIIVMPK